MRIQGKLLDRFNGCVTAAQNSKRWGPAARRRLTVITYTGRRSGRTFSTPVGYRRTDDGVVIGVRLPDSKAWWRNFLDEGGPISLRLDDTDRTGHATAHRDAKGRVSVTVRLDA
ncbi:nitroreductase/quinone reductase family protein [Actinoplanes sp. NBRC 103695]|uniref:nitroreductase/quinone reductase family protein n=1 Tax=Actinoplanes sp. NBRC 103695 TaxID=3032202 RepID=UPI0024A2E202|nr:nitroreductase/quinone reductase family protein [Actinoplanes sp. NBRC 103695]GLY94305.1 hypothetical protein Acsp02_15610 [Actinoplanes sp. NBRC 103695]